MQLTCMTDFQPGAPIRVLYRNAQADPGLNVSELRRFTDGDVRILQWYEGTDGTTAPVLEIAVLCSQDICTMINLHDSVELIRSPARAIGQIPLSSLRFTGEKKRICGFECERGVAGSKDQFGGWINREHRICLADVPNGWTAIEVELL